jgi:hypothetical protein
MNTASGGRGTRQFAMYNTPCCGERSCYGASFLNVLHMKLRVRITARLDFIYFRNKARTYMGG